MRIHMISLFHTIVSQAYSHCAFTGKVLRFAKMMRARGAEVIEYGNEGSESEASEHVVLRPRKTVDIWHPRTGFVGSGADLGSPSHVDFSVRLRRALASRVQPGDIIAHPYGHTHAELVSLFPQAIHVETGIGYEGGPFGAYRIFESETWRHWHLGKYGREGSQNPRETWVVPNYYDLADWPTGEGKGGYFAFMARKCNAKGLGVLAEIIKAYRGPHHFRIAGQGEEWQDWKDFERDITTPGQGTAWGRATNVGELRGRERAAFLGDAVALLCPTQFVEPFGGASIEAMLCGTPAIGSAWGAYVETLPPWAQCRTVEDWLRAMNDAASNRFRRGAALQARNHYSLEVVGAQYERIFEEIRNVSTSA